MAREPKLGEADTDLYRRNISLLEEQVAAHLADVFPLAPLLAAIRAVPRHLFVHPSYRSLAYTDRALPTSGGLTTSAPSAIARMLAELRIRGQDRVLEIGTGTGYQAAVLAELGAQVFSIEIDRGLALQAARILEALGYKTPLRAARGARGVEPGGRGGVVRLFWGNGSGGLPQHAPYHAIVVAASVASLAAVAPLASQLAEGGRLVVPVGSRHEQQLHVLRRSSGRITVDVVEGATFDFLRLVASEPR